MFERVGDNDFEPTSLDVYLSCQSEARWLLERWKKAKLKMKNKLKESLKNAILSNVLKIKPTLSTLLLLINSGKADINH